MKSTQGDCIAPSRKGKHINESERQQIEYWRLNGKSITEIATLLQRHRSTIQRELKRGTVTNKRSDLSEYQVYRAQRAQDDYVRNSGAGGPYLKLSWDPTQPIATRPLAIQKDGTWYTYGLDFTKNVYEVFGTTGYINTAYTYTPYGSVTATGSTTQPIQWSSEFYDSELALVYYNYRHYNPVDGRWIGRDFIKASANMYCYAYNNVF